MNDEMEKLRAENDELRRLHIGATRQWSTAIAEFDELTARMADAELLLGAGWRESMAAARGQNGTKDGAAVLQCAKLAGDLASMTAERDELWEQLKNAKQMQESMADSPGKQALLELEAKEKYEAEIGQLKAQVAQMTAHIKELNQQ